MKKKILVVDNHLLILKLMKDFLENEGHEVMTAFDGLSALNVLKDYIPDIIFLDIVMPNINGERLCKIIRNIPKFRTVYIVILSGIAVEEKIDFQSIGADACIAKGPFNKVAENVIEVIKQSEKRFNFNIDKKIKGLDYIYGREISFELLASKRHFELILANITDGILEINKDTQVIYANASAISFFNIPEEDLLASDFIKLFDDKYQKTIKTYLIKIGSSAVRIKSDSILLNKKYISIELLPVKCDIYQPSIIVIIKDITEKKELENMLKDARDKIEYLVEQRIYELSRLNEDLLQEIKNRKIKEEELKKQLKFF